MEYTKVFSSLYINQNNFWED